MKPSILLALDGSEAATRAVKHVGEIICGHKPFEITLYHVAGMSPTVLEHPGGRPPDEERLLAEELQREQELWLKEAHRMADEEICEPAKRILKDAGMHEECVTIRTKLATDAHPDVAVEIIREAAAGHCDAVVMGKRGRSMLKKFMFGSVSSKVVHHIQDCAIWIVE